MNEENKSMWRKPWSGPRGRLLWFVCFTAGLFVVIFCIGLVTLRPEETMAELVFGSLLLALGIALEMTLIIALVRWLCCWRNLRRLFFGVACVATLVALFYVEENVRGKLAWKRFKAQWEAKGEHFDLAGIAPPTVPDDQNFAMSPLWVETIAATMGLERAKTWYGDKVAALGHTNFVNRLAMPPELYGKGLDFTARLGNWEKSEPVNLAPLQEYYRKLAAITNYYPVALQPQTPAEDVLLALSRYDATLEELRQASQLPFSRFPLSYSAAEPFSILLPHLASFKKCAQTLHPRVLAELESGQTEKALDDWQLMLRLIEAMRGEPFLISHLVRIAMLHISAQPLWEGLAHHKWNDAQLAALEAELGKLDFLADYQLAMRGEMASGSGTIDYVRRTRDGSILDIVAEWPPPGGGHQGPDSFGDVVRTALFKLAPGGWFEQNKLTVARMHVELYLPIVNTATRTASPEAVNRAAAALEKLGLNPFTLFARILLPALTKCPWKFARAQAVVDLARVACALERYRLAHGEYPTSLDALVPQFMDKLPHDIIGGQPLKYRRTDDGQFLLYSVGWNETDDGGQVGLNESGKSVDNTKGDWVWRYPAK